MPYTAAQLIAAWTATTDGIPPDDVTASILTAFGTQIAAGTATDTQALTFVINNADKTTAVANLAYLFFTGKSPSKLGLDYLVNSATNATDLNDPYYTKFGLENRYINFAANLGVLGEGSLAFAATYGSMTFAAFVASVYEKIVGSSYATAAGINATNAIADIVSRQTALTKIATDAGMITPTSTAAQADIALKAATAGYIMGEGIKADVGIYAAASNNFTFALLSGTPTYNVDLVTTYAALGGGLGSPVAPYFLAPVIPAGSTFRLTTGVDAFTGLAGNDSFNASDLQPDGVTKAVVFNATDVLNGGLGTDTLSIISSNGAAYTTAAATVSSIEAGTVTGDNAVTVTAGAWSGLTSLVVNSVGSATVTAPATSTVAVNATLGTGTVTVDGGTNVTVAATGANVGAGTAASIGTTTAPTGTVTVNTTTIGAGAAGAINVKGGTTVNINQTAVNAFGATLTHGAVTVTGTAATTSVTVNATKEATASGSAAGVVANTVTINDVNGATATANTISTVVLSSYWTTAIKSSALTTLSLTTGNGAVNIDNSGIVAPVNKTLGLTLNGTTGGTILDQGSVYTTFNVATTGAASANTFDSTSVTALTVTGGQVLTLTATLPALVTTTVSGTAGLVSDLSSLGFLTSINASGTSGAMTVTLDATKASYAGGSGVDTVTLKTGAPTQTVTGGTGVADVLTMTSANAVTAAAAGVTFTSKVSGFERLVLSDAAAASTINLTTLGGAVGVFNHVTAAGGATFTLSGLGSGGTLALTGAGTAYDITNAALTPTLSDTINLSLSSAAGTAFGTVIAPDVETLAITTTGTGSPTHTLTVTDAAAKTITVSGTAGLTLTQTSTALTSVDASGITAGGFTWTSNPIAAVAVVKGSATGTNAVSLAANTATAVTYTGGTGDDTVALPANKATTLVLGAGTNLVTGGAANDQNLSITGLGGADTVNAVGNGANTVNLGDGTNAYTGGTGGVAYTGGTGVDTVVVGGGVNNVSLGDGNNNFTGGTGVDTVTVGGGANTITLGASADTVNITAASSGSTVFSTITVASGDRIGFTAKGTEVFNTVEAAGGSFALKVTAAIVLAGDGSTNGKLGWFRDGGDTYIVENRDSNGVFDNGTDYIVKLVGSLDLSSGAVATYSGVTHYLTIT